jgi:antitoxin YefM
MIHVSLSELTKNLPQLMDRASADRETILVQRDDAEAMVMLSLPEFESLMETVHLLRSPANAKRLTEALADANNGALSPHELID